MVFEFKFPDVGEGIHEGEIVNWLVEEGDQVAADEDIVEVMTDKATVQISSPRAGTIQEIRFGEGDVVEVGQTFVLIATEGGEPAQEPSEPDPETEPEAQETEPEQPQAEAAGPEPDTVPAAGTNGEGSGRVHARRTPEGVLAPPSVRIEARKRGIDITEVEGSGPAGRISLADLDAHEPASTTQTERPAAPGSSATVDAGVLSFDLPSVDRADAREIEPIGAPAGSPRAGSLQATSLQAHFTHSLTVGSDALVSAVEDAQEIAARHDVRIDDVAFVLKAVAQALANHPRCNALVDEDTDELVIPEEVHLGVAVPTEDGLQIRVVPSARGTSLVGIARALQEPVDTDVEPTITVTTLGAIGGYVSTPILIHPQVSGIVIGSLRDVGRLDDGQIVPGKELTLAFSFDHRWVDGYDGALFAEEVRRRLEQPGALLLDDEAV